jgi:predicted lysophospholipase L1 biosynthesis ABC-type transport system permease subunit
MALQGFAVGLHGWTAPWLTALFGAPGPRQGGMGFGAALTAAAGLMLLCRGLAARGWCRGDAFVTSAIGLVVALIGVGIGLLASLFLTRTLQAVLNDVQPTDPGVFALNGALVLAVSLFASYLPARAAGRVDPMVVLRDN